jgi:hypothetical protein
MGLRRAQNCDPMSDAASSDRGAVPRETDRLTHDQIAATGRLAAIWHHRYNPFPEPPARGHMILSVFPVGT